MPAINFTQSDNDVFDTRQLRLLVTVDEEGSLSAAARRLSLTQSAVSHSLRRLEEDAGVRLVERNERGAALTAAGECLARHAAAILQRMTAAREELHRLQNWGSERLRVGASSTACQYLLPQVLCAFHERRPRCTVEVSTEDTDKRLDDLRSGRIDLAVVEHAEFDDATLKTIGLFEDTLCLVSPAGAAPGLVCIGYAGGTGFARAVAGVFERLRPSAEPPVTQMQCLEAIRSLVLLGAGCAVLPHWLVRDDIAAGKLCVEWPHADSPRGQWAIVHRSGHRLSVSENEWVEQCTAHGRRLIDG